MEDIKLTCQEKDCGKEFMFAVHEQKFYEKNGFTPPKRCRACRDKRRRVKAEKESKGVDFTGGATEVRSLCCDAAMVNGGRQCETCGGPGI